MEKLQAYRFRIYPNHHQLDRMVQIAGCCRLVYNLALEQRSQYYRKNERSFSYVQQASELPSLKEAFPFLKDCPAQSLQTALRNLDTAFQRFFSGLGGYPTYKSRRSSMSFTLPDPAQISIDWHRSEILLPKFGKTKRDNGPLKMRAHRALKGNIRQVTVSQEGGLWFASILVKRQVKDTVEVKPSSGTVVGIDCGIAISVMATTGDAFTVTGQKTSEAKRHRRLNQQLSRQKRGSANRRKTIQKIASLKAREARRRKDSLHKISRHLVNNHDCIVIEDLKVQNMTKSAKGSIEEPGRMVKQKSGLNRSILNQGWGELRRQLGYKADWAGKNVVEVNPRNTSRTCPSCRYISPDNRKTQSNFACVCCGFTANADMVAAYNIKQLGLAKLGLPPSKLPEDLRYQPVERSSVSISVKQESQSVSPALLEVA